MKPLPHPSFFCRGGESEALQMLTHHSQAEKPGGCSCLEDKIRRKQGCWSSASGLSFLRVAMGTRSRPRAWVSSDQRQQDTDQGLGGSTMQLALAPLQPQLEVLSATVLGELLILALSF